MSILDGVSAGFGAWRVLSLALGVAFAALVSGLAASLWAEGERRAPRRLIGATAPVGVAWGLVVAFGPLWLNQAFVAVALAGITLVGVAVASGAARTIAAVSPGSRADGRARLGVGRRPARPDERDTLFARMAYTPGGPAFEDYYARHPERRETDDAIRALPELCAEGSLTYHPLNSRIAPANFGIIADWRTRAEASGARRQAAGEGSEEGRGDRVEVPDQSSRVAMSARLKGLARFYGARDAGIAELSPEFVYTHVGRREAEYGRDIPADLGLDHRYALVFTVEMDYRFMGAAPGLPVVVESSHQYLEAAKVALAVDANIRALGWDARAHIDGDYLAVLPPLAVLAGLGEVGRMGILVTEDAGARVRLAMVTTNLPLVPDGPRPFGLQAFCRVCRKCAQNCPSRAISPAAEVPPAGWGIYREPCYSFWRKTGTDCAICLNSCPYSKPRSSFHRLARRVIRGSDLARRAAVWLDDYLYGRRPFKRWEPDWMRK